MVEKIIVNPSSVRGLGDILDVKGVSDYSLYGSTLSSGTDTVNGATKNIIVMGDTFDYLFYDKCNNPSMLSSYGSSVLVRGSTATITMTYDSTENAYKLSGTGNYHAMIPIPILDDVDEYSISADFKAQNINANACGFFLDNRNDTTSYGLGVFIHEYNHEFASRQYRVSGDGTLVNETGLTFTASNWYHIEMTVNGSSLTGKLYNGDTLMATVSQTLSVSNKQMGIFLFCENGSTNSVCYVKNIVADPYTAPVNPYTLTFSQSVYLAGPVSVTLKNNGVAMSGETVTFTWEDSGLPGSATATTNSNGVATTNIYPMDDVTVTASYQGATATCTVYGDII